MRAVRSNKKKRQAKMSTDEYDLSSAIKDAVNQANKKLHRTWHHDDPKQHRGYVCVVCDCFIIGSDPFRTMNRNQLKANRHRLGV